MSLSLRSYSFCWVEEWLLFGAMIDPHFHNGVSLEPFLAPVLHTESLFLLSWIVRRGFLTNNWDGKEEKE